eukprot:jgi/Tetstr1/459818/TSEL_005167.t1
MDNNTDNPDPYRKERLLGDWENKYRVAYMRFRYDVRDLDGFIEDHTEVDELDATIARHRLDARAAPFRLVHPRTVTPSPYPLPEMTETETETETETVTVTVIEPIVPAPK